MLPENDIRRPVAVLFVWMASLFQTPETSAGENYDESLHLRTFIEQLGSLILEIKDTSNEVKKSIGKLEADIMNIKSNMREMKPEIENKKSCPENIKIKPDIVEAGPENKEAILGTSQREFSNIYTDTQTDKLQRFDSATQDFEYHNISCQKYFQVIPRKQRTWFQDQETMKALSGKSVSEAELCTTLFKEKDYQGEKYSMLHDSYILDVNEHYTSADSVWNSTSSFRVEDGCKLTACNDTNFLGNCKDFSESSSALPNGFNILSTSCFCARNCSCTDVLLRQSICARAYLSKCSVCNANYVDFKPRSEYAWGYYNNEVKAIKVRQGCQLKIFTEESFEGEELTVRGYTDWDGVIGSYSCSCSETHLPRSKPSRPDYPPFIDVPNKIENVSMMLQGELKLHPGLLAALQSRQNRRSSKNAYILILGSTGDAKSVINSLFDNLDYTDPDYCPPDVSCSPPLKFSIQEIRISVPVDELRIHNSELRIINIPGLAYSYAKVFAAFDDYLSNHEELHDRIPNIVLVFHKFNDQRFSGESSNFVRMLIGLNAFQKRITDENYSNVVFVLSNFMSESKSVTRQPTKKLAAFKDVIEAYSLFPKPIVITTAENNARYYGLPSENGDFRLPNGDLFPRNIFEKVQRATLEGADPIGNAVINAVSRDSFGFNIRVLDHAIDDASRTKEAHYYTLLTETKKNTEISQMLTVAYKRLGLELQTRFSKELSLLQKALYIRNIRTRADIPTMSSKILKLLAELSQNEITTYLLKYGLGLQPPVSDENLRAGYSYNVFLDTPLAKSPYDLEKFVNSDIGYLLPTAIICTPLSQVSDVFNMFTTRAEYLNDQLCGLGIQRYIRNITLEAEIKAGYNIQNESHLNGRCQLSAVREFHAFQLVLNDSKPLNSEFTNFLKRLPNFDSQDANGVYIWKEFFHSYGTHVVKSVYGGGAIEIQLKSNKNCTTEMTTSIFDFIQFAEDQTVIRRNSSLLLHEDVDVVLTFTGGHHVYQTSIDLRKMNLEDAYRFLYNWKKSLRFSPIILASEVKLLPLNVVARNFGLNISVEIERAQTFLFNLI